MISVERGHDPRRFILTAFGGAGPLHACEVAESLGIPRVLVPARPGVLSAMGMTVSEVSRDYSMTLMLSGIPLPLAEARGLPTASSSRAAPTWRRWERATASRSSRASTCAIGAVLRAHDSLRPRGPRPRDGGGPRGGLPRSPPRAVQPRPTTTAPSRSSPRVFGSKSPARRISARTPRPRRPRAARRGSGAASTSTAPCGNPDLRPLRPERRAHRRPRHRDAVRQHGRHSAWDGPPLRSAREHDHREDALMDAVSLEIFKGLLSSVAEEMGAALGRSAFSANIKERRDYSCAVFGRRGAPRGAGRPPTRPPRIDAGVRLRRDERPDPRAGRHRHPQRPLPRGDAPARHHPRGAVHALGGELRATSPTAPITPTSAARRPARCPWPPSS